MSAVFTPLSLSQAERPKSQMGTYFVQTWGCQMNEEDSEQMALYLEQIGFTPAENIQSAQVVLLNTCSVRKKPEDKAFSMLGELAIRKRAQQEMVIGVCGCMAQLRAKEIHLRVPEVDFVVGTGNLSDIPLLVQESLNERRFQSRLDLPERKGSIVTELPQRYVRREGKLKSFVPIQYGCDKFCTFCIVPTTRGRERSRPTEEILEEVKRLADAGTKEVTLLGQTVNSYGKNLADGKVPFSELLYLVSKVSGIERIRFTSPYPRDFKSDVIDAIRDIPQVMEHLHMPIQAGTDTELKRMKRLYTIASFNEIVAEAREKIPNMSVSTDVIVGFPDETEEEFEGTMQTMRDLKFDFAYMFAYSPRPGTPAADWKNQISAAVKKDRLNQLISQQTFITEQQNAKKLGEFVEVMFEQKVTRKPGWLYGFSRCMRKVEVEANEDRIGRIATVKVTRAHKGGLDGSLTW